MSENALESMENQLELFIENIRQVGFKTFHYYQQLYYNHN